MAPAIKKVDGLHEYIMEYTSHFPSNRNLSFRAKSIAHDIDCKCEHCGDIVKQWGKKFCSHKCYASNKISKITIFSKEEIQERIPNTINIDEKTASLAEHLTDSETFCEVYNRIYNMSTEDLKSLIGFRTEGDHLLTRKSNKVNMMLSFLIRIGAYQGVSDDIFEKCLEVENYHKKTENIEYYTLLYGAEEANIRLNKKSERVKGENNPAYDHGGLLSPFSKKFIKGDISRETFEKASKSRDENNTYQTRLEYWTERHGEEEGTRLYYERQNTFSKEKLIKKYGEEEGIKKWEERQRKWLGTLNDLPESKKIEINAKKGFWRHTNPATDEMRYEGRGKTEKSYFYVIRYQPVKSDTAYIKIGVTNRNISSRFPLVTIKEVIMLHESSRYVNFHIERDVKKFIFENSLNILIESESNKFDGWTECVDATNRDLILEVVYDAIERNTKEV